MKANKINRESRKVNGNKRDHLRRTRNRNVNGDAAIWRRNDTSTMNVAVEYRCVCFQVKKDGFDFFPNLYHIIYITSRDVWFF